MSEWMNIISKRELDEDDIQKIFGAEKVAGLLSGPKIRRAERKLKEQGIINKPKKITPQQSPAQDTDSLLAEAEQTAQNLKVGDLQRQLGSAPATPQNVPSAPDLPAINVPSAPNLPVFTQKKRTLKDTPFRQRTSKDTPFRLKNPPQQQPPQQQPPQQQPPQQQPQPKNVPLPQNPPSSNEAVKTKINSLIAQLKTQIEQEQNRPTRGTEVNDKTANLKVLNGKLKQLEDFKVKNKL